MASGTIWRVVFTVSFHPESVWPSHRQSGSLKLCWQDMPISLWMTLPCPVITTCLQHSLSFSSVFCLHKKTTNSLKRKALSQPVIGLQKHMDGKRPVVWAPWKATRWPRLYCHTYPSLAPPPLATPPFVSWNEKPDCFCKELAWFLWAAIPYGKPNATDTPGQLWDPCKEAASRHFLYLSARRKIAGCWCTFNI